MGLTREKCLLPTVMAGQHHSGWNEPGTEGQTRHTLTCMWNLNKQQSRLEWWLPEAEVRRWKDVGQTGRISSRSQ